MRFADIVRFLGIVVSISALAQSHESAALRATDLRCDAMVSPAAVEDAHPLLTWRYANSPSATAMPMVRVTLATSEAALHGRRSPVWQSTWMAAPLFSLRYAGPALAKDTKYFWQVQIKGESEGAAASEEIASFHIAAGVWFAHWIQAPWSTERDGAELDGSRPMPIFRRQFVVRKAPVSASLRIAGLGQYEAQVNGNPPLAENSLLQAWTDYRKTITYDTYSVRLKRGKNVLAVLLGNGMYNVQRTSGRYTKFEGSFGVPKLLAELRICYADGTSDLIATDTTWQVAHGPVTFSSVYGGEDLDARKWPRHWDSPGTLDNAAWKAAATTSSPGGKMMPAIAPLVTAHEVRGVAAIRVLSPSRTIYDMGQNLAGWPHVKLQGPEGALLRLTAGELLNPDGTVSQASTGQPQWWSYTLRGSGEEDWTPRFSYWGYRYIQADWIGGVSPGNIHEIQSIALSSDSPVTGSFASSSELLNRIHGIIVWAMHNNEVSLLTDCPHRERLGWLEQTHLVAPGLLFNNDLQRLYAATTHNIADAQQTDGMVPTIAPQYTKFGPKYPIYDDSPEWGSAAILAQWTAYRFYGEKNVLEQNYGVMQRYIAYLQSRATDGIVAYGLGDWYDIGPGDPGPEKNTTLGVTGTLMLFEDALAMQQIALVLRHTADAMRYAALAETEKRSFHRHFWREDKGFYDTGSQTANAMPLALGVVPPDKRASVLAYVVADIHAHGDHITSGEVGYPYLMRALMEYGQNDLLLTMSLKTDPPSYGSQLERGATSLTEAWDANPPNSQDHFMLGAIEEWFYRGLGGIDLDLSRAESAERISIHPRIPVSLGWVKTGYDSKLGHIESDWEHTRGNTRLTVTIPAGMEATVYVPAVPGAEIRTGDASTAERPGIRLIRRNAESVVFRISAGTYHFEVNDPPPQ